MLCAMSKKAEIIIDTTVDQTESINIIKQGIKQGSIFGSMCCAITSKINNIAETVQLQTN